GINAFDLCTALTQIIFETLEGWYVDGSPVSVSDLSDPEKAAELIMSIYAGTEWIIKPTPTSNEYFEFTLLEDGTYEIKAKDRYNMPKSIVIPEKYNGKPVTSIGNYAFYSDNDDVFHGGCKSLESVTIPDSVTSIGEAAFSGCSCLTSVTIPDSITSIGERAFAYCGRLTNVSIGKWVENGRFSDIGLSSSVQEIIIRDGVTSIGDFAFYNCSKHISATLPDSVTSINDAAFYNCSSLTSLNIPDGITSIGNSMYSAFTGCSSLTYNEYDNALYLGNTNNPYVALIKAKDTSITSVTINEKTKIIAFIAFLNCSGLTSVTIPDSVTSIGYAAFTGCSSLTYNEYDNALYLGNTNNPYVALIKAKNKSITSVSINEKTKVIYDDAFSDCRKLTSMTIPDSVTSIGIGVFSECISLASITVSEGNKKYHSDGNCIIETESKALIAGCNNSVIPDDGSVTSIGSEAFYWCNSLTSVTIPDGVTSVNDYAFSCCKSLTSVTIPDSVKLISYSVFDNCDKLTSIIYTGTKALWNNIIKYYSWDDYTGDYTIHCTDGDLTKGES
ncbi:MAG: leucine-rich repeat domain-containing protein, partial [Clostridia bacterium]|nr:leucine-rich repeat domain-containing protein [Clostridia bacterium]